MDELPEPSAIGEDVAASTCTPAEVRRAVRVRIEQRDSAWQRRLTANEERHDAEIAKLREQVEMNGGHWHAAWEEARAREDAAISRVSELEAHACRERVETDK